MSADASLALLAAIKTALGADATVSGLIGGRLSSDWGRDLAAPFVRCRIAGTELWEADCTDQGRGTLSKIEVHCFAQEAGPVVALRLAAAVRAALDEAPLDLSAHDQALWWITATGSLSRPADVNDPLLSRVIVNFEAVTQPTTA